MAPKAAAHPLEPNIEVSEILIFCLSGLNNDGLWVEADGSGYRLALFPCFIEELALEGLNRFFSIKRYIVFKGDLIYR